MAWYQTKVPSGDEGSWSSGAGSSNPRTSKQGWGGYDSDTNVSGSGPGRWNSPDEAVSVRGEFKSPSWGKSLLEGLKTTGKMIGGAVLFALALPVAVAAVAVIAAVALAVVGLGTVGLLVAALPLSALAAYKVVSGKSAEQITDIMKAAMPKNQNPPHRYHRNSYGY